METAAKRRTSSGTAKILTVPPHTAKQYVTSCMCMHAYSNWLLWLPTLINDIVVTSTEKFSSSLYTHTSCCTNFFQDLHVNSNKRMKQFTLEQKNSSITVRSKFSLTAILQLAWNCSTVCFFAIKSIKHFICASLGKNWQLIPPIRASNTAPNSNFIFLHRLCCVQKRNCTNEVGLYKSRWVHVSAHYLVIYLVVECTSLAHYPPPHALLLRNHSS